jgi:hypothetical protein
VKTQNALKIENPRKSKSTFGTEPTTKKEIPHHKSFNGGDYYDNNNVVPTER